MKIPLNIHPDILYAIRLLSKRRTENMDKAISIIKNTVSDYDTDRYPDYSTGLAGIGYGIQYMICTGLIDANGDEVLSEFDRYLFLLSVYNSIRTLAMLQACWELLLIFLPG